MKSSTEAATFECTLKELKSRIADVQGAREKVIGFEEGLTAVEEAVKGKLAIERQSVCAIFEEVYEFYFWY